VVTAHLQRVLWAVAVLASLGGYVTLWFSFNAAIIVWLVAAALWIVVGLVAVIASDARCGPPPFVTYRQDGALLETRLVHTPTRTVTVISGGKQPAWTGDTVHGTPQPWRSR
jgi:hypothetical protein